MTSDFVPAAGVFAGLLDDAAVFPPGNLPLGEALDAHAGHLRAPYAALVGSFVLAAKDLPVLAAAVTDLPAGSLDLSLTVPLPGLATALAAAAEIAAVELAGLEVTVPDAMPVVEMVSAIDAALDGRPIPVFVELPRDERRPALVLALARTPYRAKLRTGGVDAGLHPGEHELAEAVSGLVSAGVPFKATAGLHHALRNTDAATGFEQHGFLNLIAATAAAGRGAGVDQVAAVLAERDAGRVVAAVSLADPSVREAFRSFGTCSVAEPVDELAALGLLPAAWRSGQVHGVPA